MKYLFVGDVHNKLYIFDDVKKLDNKYKFDKIIFMGDYVDDWGTDNINSHITLERVFELKNIYPNKFIFLIGNHELSYLGFPCSGHKFELDYIIAQELKDNIDSLDLFTIVECDKRKYVCTHAGITNDYIHNVLGGEEHWEHILNDFNKDFNKGAVNPSAITYLSMCGGYRGGIAPFSSFVWCDSRELVKCKDPIIPYQIVGHTPVPEIVCVNEDSYNYIFIDTHSTYRNGEPIGNKSYLIWNEDKFIMAERDEQDEFKEVLL